MLSFFIDDFNLNEMCTIFRKIVGVGHFCSGPELDDAIRRVGMKVEEYIPRVVHANKLRWEQQQLEEMRQTQLQAAFDKMEDEDDNEQLCRNDEFDSIPAHSFPPAESAIGRKTKVSLTYEQQMENAKKFAENQGINKSKGPKKTSKKTATPAPSVQQQLDNATLWAFQNGLVIDGVPVACSTSMSTSSRTSSGTAVVDRVVQAAADAAFRAQQQRATEFIASQLGKGKKK